MEFQKEILTILCKRLMEDKSKSGRKSALLQIKDETVGRISNPEGMQDVFEIIFKPVLKSFNDPSENCREVSINLLDHFFQHLKSKDPYLTDIINVMVQRIGEAEVQESSEEIRLLLIKFLRRIISTSRCDLMPYLNDLTKILCKSIGDPYAAIKIEVCECITELTIEIPGQFHVQSESYVKALLQGVAHKHCKVRAKSIAAVGVVVQHGTQGLVEQVVGALAERLYDSVASVRLAVILCAGGWLKELPDRYSQFARILPLVLTGLDDEISEVKFEAQRQWQKAGLQFVSENADDFKNHTDFMPETLPDYPLTGSNGGTYSCCNMKKGSISNGICRRTISDSTSTSQLSSINGGSVESSHIDLPIGGAFYSGAIFCSLPDPKSLPMPPSIWMIPGPRPSLGCRALVQREAGKLFPAALTELHEWTIPVRLQAAGLIFELVRHLEHHSTQHAAKLWPEFVLVCADSNEDQRVTDKVLGTLRLMGHFLPSSALLAVALPQEQLSLGQALCLAATLEGIPSLAEPEQGILAAALAATCTCSMQPEYQLCMLNCVSTTVRSAKECSDNVSLALLNVILCAQGLGLEHLSNIAHDVLARLSDLAELEERQLFTHHGGTILAALRPTVPAWTDHCAEKSKFVAFVQGAGTGVGAHLELVGEILIAWSGILSSAKSLADFLRVSKPLLSWSFLKSCHPNPEPFLSNLINDGILPSLVWHAGRVAEARRSQALLCFLLVAGEPSLPQSVVVPLLGPLLPLLIGALEESTSKDRLHATQIIELLVPRWAHFISAEQVNKTSVALSARLNDTSDDVRLCALEALNGLLLSLPANHGALTASPASLEHLFKCLLIQLDDKDPIFQSAVFETLKSLGKFETQILITLLNRGQKSFKNQKGCESLRGHLEQLAKD